MKKKLRLRFTSFGAIIMVAMYLCFSFWSAKTFSFKELFEGIDFEQLTKDVEAAMQNLEQKDSSPASLPRQPQPSLPQTFDQPFSPLDTTLTTPTQVPAAPTDQDQSLEKLFLDPVQITQEKGKPAVPIQISEAKQKAYDHYMEKIVELLATLEQAIETNYKLSEAFRLFFTNFQDALDEIIIQKDIIGSKKIYLALFFADTPETNQCRKEIINAVEELTKFCRQLSVSAENEIKATESEEETLKKLAEKKFQLPEPRRIIERKKRGQRGAPVSSSTPQETP